jgi:type III secretory pathway component EscT
MSGGLAALGWGALRLFGLLRMQVLWRSALGPVWEGVSAALALLLASVLLTRPGEPVALSSWLVIAVCEFLLGSVIGGLVSLPGAALLGAAQQSAAALQVPRGRGFPLLLAIACVSGGLLADLHRPLLVAARELLMLWPVGAPDRWLPAVTSLPPWILDSAHTALVLALTFATPVLLTSATLDLGLRLTARGVAVPMMDALRPWLVAAAALIALGAAWAAYPEAWLRAWPTLH